MAAKLKTNEIEKLEYVHLQRIRYNFLDNFNEIMDGLNSRLKIKNDWYDQFISSKSNAASDMEMGAERIFHYIFSQVMKHPNSSPIGSDLMYETFDSFIHIDVKTISESNWGDYKGKVVVEPNQTSYPLEKYQLSPNLPSFYSATFEKNSKTYKKPALTYFIYVLHKHASKKIYSILLVCMPNGELYGLYGDKILNAGKNKRHNIRYSFRQEPRFLLLSEEMQRDIFRIEFLQKSKELSQEKLIGIPAEKHKIPVWIEV